jgi:hypothetical protein
MCLDQLLVLETHSDFNMRNEITLKLQFSYLLSSYSWKNAPRNTYPFFFGFDKMLEPTPSHQEPSTHSRGGRSPSDASRHHVKSIKEPSNNGPPQTTYRATNPKITPTPPAEDNPKSSRDKPKYPTT